MKISSVPLELRLPSYKKTLLCRFEAEFAEDEKITIHLKLPASVAFAEQDAKAQLMMPDGLPLNCRFDGLHIISSKAFCEVKLVPFISPIALSAHDGLRQLSAIVYNFGDRKLYRTKRRLLLRDGAWQFELIAASDITVCLLPELQSQIYRATHYLSLVCSDGRQFSSVEAQERLTEMQRFLSFCHGQQVGVGFATGLDVRGEKVFDLVGMGRVDRYTDGENWLDRHGSEYLPDLYPKFLAKIRSLEWDDCFRIATYWGARANTNYTGPDGGLILLQTALERLAWDVLTNKMHGNLSARKAGELGVSGRLRLVLERFKIPTTIPPPLSEVAILAKSEGWTDGPEAFVKIRNELVHPRRRINSSRLPYYQAYVLGKWYLELVLLALLGYRGDYSNRTRLIRWVGETEAVPWA
ncbi:MAG: hypothetical protein ACRYGF_07335 [Janthinobacterium lividum]